MTLDTPKPVDRHIAAGNQEIDNNSAPAWQLRDYFTFNTDHKVIGIQYLVTSFVFYLIGGLMAVAMRTELATPNADLLNPNLYNAFMTNHGTIMILM